MPQVPIIMPQLGESIAEATIVDIKVKPGRRGCGRSGNFRRRNQQSGDGRDDAVQRQDCSNHRPSERDLSGRRSSRLRGSERSRRREIRKTGTAPPQREVAEEIPARAHQEVAPAREKKVAARDGDGARAGGLPVPVAPKGATFMSPRVRARMAELQLTTADLAGILGTGAGNRVTIKDLENFLHKIESQNGAGSFCDSRGCGRRDAAKLDATAFNDWFVGKSRSRAGGSTVARSQTRPRLIRLARACARACGNSRRGGEINRQSRCAIKLDRRRNCG